MNRRGFLGLILGAIARRKLPALKKPEEPGVSIRMVRINDVNRIDVLYGVKTLCPEWTCVIEA